MVNVKKQVAHL